MLLCVRQCASPCFSASHIDPFLCWPLVSFSPFLRLVTPHLYYYYHYYNNYHYSRGAPWLATMSQLVLGEPLVVTGCLCPLCGKTPQILHSPSSRGRGECVWVWERCLQVCCECGGCVSVFFVSFCNVNYSYVGILFFFFGVGWLG